MKKKTITIIFCLFFVTAFGQKQTINLDSIASYVFGKEDVGYKVSINENGDIQFVKIIDSLNYSKDELFTKVLSYFAFNYADSKNVLEQKDIENGLIIGKGYFKDISSYPRVVILTVFTDIYSAYHTVRVDIKDGRLRYIISLSEYDINTISSSGDYFKNSTEFISKCRPLYYDETAIDKYPKSYRKMMVKLDAVTNESQKRAFINLVIRVDNTIKKFEKTIREGNSKAESEKW